MYCGKCERLKKKGPRGKWNWAVISETPTRSGDVYPSSLLNAWNILTHLGVKGAWGCEYCFNLQGHFLTWINFLHPPQQSSYSFFRGMFSNDLEDTRMILGKTEAGIFKVLTRKCFSIPHQPRFGWLLTPRVMNSWLLQLPGCRQWIHSASVSPPSGKQYSSCCRFGKARKGVGCDTFTCNIKFPFDYKLKPYVLFVNDAQ